MIFAGLKLPAKLQRHVANLSATVQVLLAECILYAEGVEDRARTEGGKLDYALKSKKETSLLAEQLKQFLLVSQSSDELAIATAASNGKSTRQIADFLGFEQRYVDRTLLKVRREAAKAWRREQAPEATGDGATILEMFADAQASSDGSNHRVVGDRRNPSK